MKTPFVRSRWFAAALACLLGSMAARAAVNEVIVVFKTHFDIGYTDMASNIVQRYRTTMIDQALDVADRYRDLPPERQFVWTLSGWPLTQIAAEWPGQDPVRRRRVLEAFRQSRFVVHALPFTTHTETLEPEDLVRGLGFSSRLAAAAGLPLPRDAKMTDVPCHAWILPTLLRRAGVDFLHLGCNAASRSPQVPPLFLWEGPDGSRLLTMYTAESYGTGLVPPADWPYRTWLALIHTGDNHGPPTPDEVRGLLTEAAQKLPGVRVRIGRLSDFGDAIVAEQANVPVVRGDMPDTWIHGPMCDPMGARLARNARPRLESLESLQTLLRLARGRSPDATGALAEAREQSLLYGEHTWGGALWWMEPGPDGQRLPQGQAWRDARAAGRFTRSEASWAEHSAYSERTAALADRVAEEQCAALAAGVAVAGPRVVVFNPLPWRRSAEVSVRAVPPQFHSAVPTDGHERSPLVRRGEEMRFTATDLPALGYRTFTLTEASTTPPRTRIKTHDAVLENRWFRLEFDPQRGTLRSWIDKITGRDWVDAGSPYGFGQFLLERFSADDVGRYVKAYVKIRADWATNELGKPNLPSSIEVPYRAFVPGPARLEIQQTALGASVRLESAASEGMPAVTRTWSLSAHQPFVDLEVTVHDLPPDPWPQACWITLSFRIDAPQFRLGRPGSVIDPARDIVRGANRNLFAVQTGVAVFGSDTAGVGLCPIDSPLVSLDEPGCWRYAPDFVPRRPAVFVNLYNNQWSTNFRLWNGGTWSSRVRLWSFRHYDAESALVSPALEARYPVLAGMADGPAGSLKPRMEGPRVDRRGVLVTAFGREAGIAAAGDGLVLRLWELAGRSGPCRVHLPPEIPTGHTDTIDLRGQPAKPSPQRDLTVDAAGVTVELPAYAPVTVRFR